MANGGYRRGTAGTSSSAGTNSRTKKGREQQREEPGNEDDGTDRETFLGTEGYIDTEAEPGTGTSSSAGEEGTGKSDSATEAEPGKEKTARILESPTRRLDEDRQPGRKRGKTKDRQEKPPEKEVKTEYGFSGLTESALLELFQGLALIGGEHWKLEGFEARELEKKLKKIPTPKGSLKFIKWISNYEPYIGLGLTLSIILKPRIQKTVEDYRVEHAKVVTPQPQQQPPQQQNNNGNGSRPGAQPGQPQAQPTPQPEHISIGESEPFNPAYRGM